MNFDNIPESLRALDQWVCWGKPGKPPKIPYNPVTDYPAKAGQPETWTSFNKAVEAVKAEKYKGVGFEFDKNGIVGIDLDTVRDPQTGFVDPTAVEIITDLNSYTEISASGYGFHILVQADLKLDKHKTRLPGNKIERYETDPKTGEKRRKHPEIEVYNEHRYFVFTGDRYGENKAVEERNAITKATVDYYFRPQDTTVSPADQLKIGLEKDSKLKALWNGDRPNGNESADDQGLMNKLAYRLDCDRALMEAYFLSSPHVASKDPEHQKKLKRKDYLKRTIETAIKSCNRTASQDRADYFANKVNPQNIAVYEDESLPGFFDGGKFLHNVMGDYLIEKYGVCKINKAIHIYDNGIYRQGEDALHGYMLQLIPTLTDTRRREVYKYIKVNLKTPVKKVSPPNFIPFATKIYDLEADRFLDYSPEYVFLNRFPYDYKPDAPICETVPGTISRIAGGDQEIIDLLYEAMGNCFYLLNSYRGAIMLYGPNGSNGKSTLLNMITQLVGEENASFLSLQNMAERFKLIGLYGKAVNIGDDISSNYIPDTEQFKMLVTGGNLSAEHKGQDAVDFKPYAKLFFALNGLPPVNDRSRAYFDRVLLVPLTQDFSKNKDVSLKDKHWSQEEMEYLTRLAMDGLKRLIKQGDFTRPECVVEALAEYAEENNPVIGFLEEYKNLEGVPTALAYSDFCRWCENNGHRNRLTRTRFTREVMQQTGLINGKIRHDYFGGDSGRCFIQP